MAGAAGQNADRGCRNRPVKGGGQTAVAWPMPPVAWTLIGAPGGAAGVTALDGEEAGPVPAAAYFRQTSGLAS